MVSGTGLALILETRMDNHRTLPMRRVGGYDFGDPRMVTL